MLTGALCYQSEHDDIVNGLLLVDPLHLEALIVFQSAEGVKSAFGHFEVLLLVYVVLDHEVQIPEFVFGES